MPLVRVAPYLIFENEAVWGIEVTYSALWIVLLFGNMLIFQLMKCRSKKIKLLSRPKQQVPL